jgi:hypothetical protein
LFCCRGIYFTLLHPGNIERRKTKGENKNVLARRRRFVKVEMRKF